MLINIENKMTVQAEDISCMKLRNLSLYFYFKNSSRSTSYTFKSANEAEFVYKQILSELNKKPKNRTKFLNLLEIKLMIDNTYHSLELQQKTIHIKCVGNTKIQGGGGIGAIPDRYVGGGGGGGNGALNSGGTGRSSGCPYGGILYETSEGVKCTCNQKMPVSPEWAAPKAKSVTIEEKDNTNVYDIPTKFPNVTTNAKDLAFSDTVIEGRVTDEISAREKDYTYPSDLPAKSPAIAFADGHSTVSKESNTEED